MEGLDDTRITTEAKYSISFTRSERKFCLIQNYYENNKNISIQSKRL